MWPEYPVDVPGLEQAKGRGDREAATEYQKWIYIDFMTRAHAMLQVYRVNEFMHMTLSIVDPHIYEQIGEDV